MNLRGFAAVLPNILQWANSLHWNLEVADQSMINDYFPAVHGRPLDILSEPYNWEAYWGCSPSVSKKNEDAIVCTYKGLWF
ncbi:MAG: hypothetical protein FRX49_10246 [Trebouxia sp. A1-2]|nr:MAG: hypothetical protein FRX49_10246 [Trebouxia sp. A1-2]